MQRFDEITATLLPTISTTEPNFPTGFTANGRVHPRGRPCTWFVEYGPTSAYGTTTSARRLPGKLTAHYKETWDADLASFLGGIGSTALTWQAGGFVRYSSEGGAGDDGNHVSGLKAIFGNVAGRGYLHLPLYIHHGQNLAAGAPFARMGGGFPDFRGATLSMKVRGNAWDSKGATLKTWIQAPNNQTKWDQPVPNAANWFHSGAGTVWDDAAATGTWQTVTVTLRNSTHDFTYGGRNDDHAVQRYWYGELDGSFWDGETTGGVDGDAGGGGILGNMFDDIFPVQCINVNQNDPPVGSLDFDDFEVTYRQHNVCCASNGGTLVVSPAGGTGTEYLTDGWRNVDAGGPGEWQSANPAAFPLDFEYSFAKPITLYAFMVHNSTSNPSANIEVAVSEDNGANWTTIATDTLPNGANGNFNYVYRDNRDVSNAFLPLHTNPVNRVRVRVTSAVGAIAGLGEIEFFGRGADEETDNNWYDVNRDILLPEATTGTYHYRIGYTIDGVTKYGPDQTVVIPTLTPTLEFCSPEAIRASGGTTTLYGTNLAVGTPTVDCNGSSPTSIVEKARGRLVCTLPALPPGRYDPVVTTAHGVTNSVPFLVYDFDTETVAPGGTLVISGGGFGTVTNVFVGGTPADFVLSGGGSTLTVTVHESTATGSQTVILWDPTDHDGVIYLDAVTVAAAWDPLVDYPSAILYRAELASAGGTSVTRYSAGMISGDLPRAYSASEAKMVPLDGQGKIRLPSGRVIVAGGAPQGHAVESVNTIWYSDDNEVTWAELLPSTAGSATRPAPAHTFGFFPFTYGGTAYVYWLGSDPFVPSGDVFRIPASALDVGGDPNTAWERVSTTCPTSGLALYLYGTLGSTIYVGAGQTDILDGPANKNWWKSEDGGATWTDMGAIVPANVWGTQVGALPEKNGKLWIAGSGRYDSTVNDFSSAVVTFDGTAFTTVLADGHGQFPKSRYHSLAVDPRTDELVRFNGSTWDGVTLVGDTRSVHRSPDGLTWTAWPAGDPTDLPWGNTHAQAALSRPDGIAITEGFQTSRVHLLESHVGGLVGTLGDLGSQGLDVSQATDDNKPILDLQGFASSPGLAFTRNQWLKLAAPKRDLANGVYVACIIARTRNYDGAPANAGPNQPCMLIGNSDASVWNGLGLRTDLITMTAATNASPIVVTTDTDHKLATGDRISINADGNMAANGDWTVTVLSPTTFALDGSTGSGAFTAGAVRVARLAYGYYDAGWQQIVGGSWLDDGKTHVFAVVHTTTTVQLWVDGAKVAEQAAVLDTSWTGADSIGVGYLDSDAGQFVMGSAFLLTDLVAAPPETFWAKVQTFAGRYGAGATPEPPAVTLSSLSFDLADTAGGGKPLVLTGSGFTGATAVAHASSFVVDSDTQITAVLAANAPGSVGITVTTPGGTSNALSLEYWNPTVPATPTGDWDNYDGGNWVNTGSVGSDADSGTPPTLGAALNGYGTADFVHPQFLDTFTYAENYTPAAGFELFALVNVRSTQAAGNAFDDPAIFSDPYMNLGVNNDGVRATIFSGGWKDSLPVPITLDNWGFVNFSHDGVNGYLAVNNGTPETWGAGVNQRPDGFYVATIGRSAPSTATTLDHRLARLITYSAPLSAPDRVKMQKYMTQRYNL